MSESPIVVLPVPFLREMADAADPAGLVGVVTDWMAVLTEAEQVTMMRLAGGKAAVISRHGDNHLGDASYGLDGTLLGEVIDEGAVRRIDDLRAVDHPDARRILDRGYRGSLVAPLSVAGRDIGILTLVHPGIAHFSELHARTVHAVALVLAPILHVQGELAEQRRVAATDPLTGAGSRAAVLAELEELFAAGRSPSVAFLDIDRFKAINDTYGHSAGDEALKEVSRRLVSIVGEDGTVGRLGGDEFLVVFPDDPRGRRAEVLRSRLTEGSDRSIAAGPRKIPVTVSLGTADLRSVPSAPTGLLHTADQAMYRAKRAYLGPASDSDRRLRGRGLDNVIDSGIDRAMATGEMTMYLQPIRDLRTREILGAETLVRWDEPNLGPIPIGRLLQRVAVTGRTEVFTRWSAAESVSKWRQVRESVPWFHDKGFSFNLSAGQVANDWLPAYLIQLLDEHRLRIDDLIVEIVESEVIDEKADHGVHRLSEAGFRIALDDFGSGHNGLVYFNRLPVDAVKFDRELIAAVSRAGAAEVLMRHLMDFVRETGLISLAEGIESESAAETARDLGIQSGQGWHLGRPLPLDRFIELARAESPDDSLVTFFDPSEVSSEITGP